MNIFEPIRASCPKTRNGRFALLSIVPVYFIVAGLCLQPPLEILHGMQRIIEEPDFLITDYFVVGGVGAALCNAGLLMLISIAVIFALGREMDGHAITSSCLIFGFSLFGKNLLNIWTILLGVFLYAHYHRTSFSRYIYVGLYGTSLSPIITELMRIETIPLSARFTLSLLVGVMIGFLLPPLSTHLHYAHMGYSLYNVGFSGGIIATVIVSVLKSFGVEIQSRLIWAVDYDKLFFVLLSVLFGGMIAAGLFAGKMAVLTSYRKILKTSGVSGTDYLIDEGGAATVFNMGINGLFAMGMVLLAGGSLNGPTIGGIFTIVGFSATGKHLRNIAPIMLGVALASLAGKWNLSDPSPLLALLFSTTLAPIAGEFGFWTGVIAGFIHASVALNVGIVYGGMNLYNNGFAGGLVAIFMVPVIRSVRDRKARARGGLSL